MTPVRELTERRKRSLLRSHQGKNSLHESGLKPSGPTFAGYARGGKYLAASTESANLTALAALLGIVAIGLRRISTVASIIVGGAGLALLYRSIRQIFAPSDHMTERDTGVRNPNATLQHLEGEKSEIEIEVARSINDVYQYCHEHPHVGTLEFPSEVNVEHQFESKASRASNRTSKQIFREEPDHVIAWRSAPHAASKAAGALRLYTSAEGHTRIAVFVKQAFQEGSQVTAELRKNLQQLKEELENTLNSSSAQA